MGQKLVKPGGIWVRTHISETVGWIYTIWSSVELSRPVVVQHHGHLTLTLGFQGKILKMLYHRNGRDDWHGKKEMWVDRLLDPLCDFDLWFQPWPWPLIFKIKIWKSRNWQMGCPIDMELKGCESTECWTHVVTFNFDLAHDLDLEYSLSNFEIAVSWEWECRSAWNERDMSWKGGIPTVWPWALILDFQGQILKMLYLKNGGEGGGAERLTNQKDVSR